jgi:SSS family transporter
MGYIVGRVMVSVLFIPSYFRGELFTSYELLQRRFGAPVKNVAAIIFLVTRTFADGIRLFATALVIAVVTQMPVTLTVLVLGVAMIVYTVRGGVAAVIWTDVVQMFIYVGGALIIFFGLLELIPGGWSEVTRVGATHFQVFDFSADPKKVYTFWAGLLGGLALTLATHGTDQFLVQRLLSAKSAKQASAGLVMSGFIVFAQFALFLTIGVMLWVFYQQTPLPVPVDRADKIVSVYVLHNLGPGLAGLIIAAIVAAALSPSINAMAATTVNDFYLRYRGAGREARDAAVDDAYLLRLSKRLTIFWGVVQLLVALGAQWLDQSVLDAGLSVLSLTTGPVLGAFCLGVLTNRANTTGALAGIAVSAVSMFTISFTTKLAWTWYVAVGSVICFTVGYGVSLLTNHKTGIAVSHR